MLLVKILLTLGKRIRERALAADHHHSHVLSKLLFPSQEPSPGHLHLGKSEFMLRAAAVMALHRDWQGSVLAHRYVDMCWEPFSAFLGGMPRSS